MKTIDLQKQLNSIEFSRSYFHGKKPVLIKGAMKNTKECILWTPGYLTSKIGAKEIKLKYSKRGVFSQHTGEMGVKTLPFEEAASLIISANQDKSYYLQQYSVDKNFPELLTDVEFPEWILATDIKLSTNLWFGSGHCVSPLHFDSAHNFLLQVFGRKNIILISPDDSEYLYPVEKDEFKNVSNVNPELPDYEKYPLFKNVRQSSVLLEPGDVIYIPPNWWHQVRSLDVSISLNFWWNRFELIDGMGMEFVSVESLQSYIKSFLTKGVDIDLPDAEGETILLKASLRGYTNIVKALLLLGANPYIKSTFYRPGATAVSLAAEYGHVEIVKLLNESMSQNWQAH